MINDFQQWAHDLCFARGVSKSFLVFYTLTRTFLKRRMEKL